METIYLFLVHTGNRGNLFHEIPCISLIISISISIYMHTMEGVKKNLNIFMLFPFKVDV